MDARKTDLNLLRVFDALMEDGNLTRAGYRLSLSQPAMSHALSKLRGLAGDPLFVRVPSGMKPTDHAVRIAPSVREGLRLLRSALEGEAAFDPHVGQRQFQLLLSDIGELVYLPRLMQHLGHAAPGVSLRVLNRPREAYVSAFIAGEADLAIGFLPGLSAGFYQQRLFSDDYVCLVRGRSSSDPQAPFGCTVCGRVARGDRAGRLDIRLRKSQHVIGHAHRAVPHTRRHPAPHRVARAALHGGARCGPVERSHRHDAELCDPPHATAPRAEDASAPVRRGALPCQAVLARAEQTTTLATVGFAQWCRNCSQACETNGAARRALDAADVL
jgi:DNA-binding transcriptional LysR family regulator